jgi:SAM-dependent methyltransferase
MSVLQQLKKLGVEDGTILDVGAFSGMFLQNARRLGFDVVAVEPIWEAYHHLSEALGIAAVHGDLFSAAFPPESFAAVSLLDVIEHIPDPVVELQEVYRVLKPGGVLVMTTPNVAGLMQRVVGAKRKIFGQPWCPIDDVPWHLWGFTPHNFQICMRKAGFTVERVDFLEPSPFSTNLNSGSTSWKKLALRAVAQTSKILQMSDRMVAFGRK